MQTFCSAILSCEMYWWEDCFYTFFSHHLVKTILSPTVEGTINLKAVNAEMTPEILQEVLLGCIVGLMVGLTGAGGHDLVAGVPTMTAVAPPFLSPVSPRSLPSWNTVAWAPSTGPLPSIT
jgi:hypothetical protein